MKLFAGAAFLILTCSGAFADNLLLNPSFESPGLNGGTSDTYGAGSTAITDWTITGDTCGDNCVALLRDDYTEPSNIGTLSFEPEDGDYSVDVTGSGNTLDGGIEQTVSDAAGTLYALSFWVGNMDNSADTYTIPATVEVLVNGSPLGTFTNADTTANELNWQLFTVDFTGTGSDTVQFQNATAAGGNEAGLDNVNLAAATTPEPASAWLIAAGALALAARRWKHRLRRAD